MRADPKARIVTDLMRRVERLGDLRGSMSGATLLDEIDEIGHLARRIGLDDVEGLAAMLGSAVTLHGLGPILLSYLDLIRDAVSAHGDAMSSLPFVPPVAPVAVTGLRA